MSQHKTVYNKHNEGVYYVRLGSYDILDYGDTRIVLIEDYPCDNVDQLRAREEHWRTQFKDVCTNRNSAFGLDKQRLKKKTNSDKYKQKRNELRRTDKYKQKRNEKLRNEKRLCECGVASNSSHMARHTLETTL